jgi:SOS-response transcriptional repressor LexA
MEPLFHPGDYLIVNPNLKPAAGDYVIAKLPSEGKATFKKLVEREGIIILRPLNPAYEDIVLTPEDEFEILGKVVERKTIF